MSLTNNLGAYEDCVDLFDKALQSKTGIRVSVATEGDGYQMFTRLHYLRKLLRDKSMMMHQNDDPRYNTCAYDPLIVRKPKEIDGEWWIYIEQRSVSGKVEEIDANARA